jgi:SAM-dependent methyltransferase
VSFTDADNVGEFLVSARSFAEYEAMFSLSASDLAGRVLDCPAGAASFTAHAARLGALATAVDPVYAIAPRELRRLVVSEQDRGSAHTIAGSDRYVWDFYGDSVGHRAMRWASALTFVDDIAAHPDRYVVGSLPALPFDDGQFDLVLSSHFLFTYADRLDGRFHHRALVELLRVCSGEVRVFPLLDQGGHALGQMTEEVLGWLRRGGATAEVRPVAYEFQRGGNQMLVLSGSLTSTPQTG